MNTANTAISKDSAITQAPDAYNPPAPVSVMSAKEGERKGEATDNSAKQFSLVMKEDVSAKHFSKVVKEGDSAEQFSKLVKEDDSADQLSLSNLE